MAQTPQPMEQQVAVDATVGQANFSGAFDNAAMTPDLLGQLGSQLATTASAELAKQRGTEAGLYPSGSALPPITSADKAYVDAYNNQSQATLTLQAQSVFNQADENMQSMNKLSAGNIAQYQQTLKQSLGDILQVAPKDIQQSLANQFQQQIQTNAHSYNSKLINQNKAQAADASSAALKTINEQIHNAALSGDEEGAKKLYENAAGMIKNGENSAIYSKSEAQTLSKSAQLNYLSSREIKKGMDAKHAGKIAEWEASLADEKTKPADVSWGDWETIRSNSFRYMGQVQSFDRQQQQLVASNASTEIHAGTMTAERMDSYRNQLSENPVLFNNLQIQFSSLQRKQNSQKGYEDFYVANWQNPDQMRNATPKNIDASFAALSKLKMQTAQAMGNPISQDEADYQTAASAAVPVPSFNKKLSQYASSGNPQMMREALHRFDQISQLPGFKAAQFANDKNASGTLETFRHLLEQGKDDSTAAQLATEINSDKNEETYKLINAQTNEFWNKQGQSTAQKQSFIINELNVPREAVAADPTGMYTSYQKIFNNNMQVTRGNADVARAMTKQEMNTTWGTTNINGEPSFQFLPPEKTIGLNAGATPLMQLDIHAQLEKQFETGKKAYDSGQWDFYYRVKPRTTLNEYSEAKKAIRENGMRDKKYGYHQTLIDEFERGAPVQLEKVTRKGSKEVVQDYEARIESNPFQGINQKTGELSGAYDIAIKNPKTGASEPFLGLWGALQSGPSYRPRTNWIRNNYMTTNGLDPSITPHDVHIMNWDQYAAQKKYVPDSLNIVSGLAIPLPRRGE